MLMKVFNRKGTGYSQSQLVALKLIEAIRRGKYKPGMRLPGLRVLAEQFDVGRQVALSAVSQLAKKDYVYTVRGSGTYVNPHRKSGLYYRIGLFVNILNPVNEGRTFTLFAEALEPYGFTLCLGFNFETDLTLEKWFRNKPNLDGLILTGAVRDSLLEFPKKHHIPYVVIGNYDLSPEHPQASLSEKENYCRVLVEQIQKHGWKRIAALGGKNSWRADREIMDAIRKAQEQAGLTVDEEKMLSSPADGYSELTGLFSRKPLPDVLFIVGEHWHGLEKYCRNYPDFQRPAVVVSTSRARRMPENLYDYVLKLPGDRTRDRVELAVKLLLEQLGIEYKIRTIKE